ncbi:MAG: hypothetical protein V3U11_12595, partial [Planctomycetota bacterium]
MRATRSIATALAVALLSTLASGLAAQGQRRGGREDGYVRQNDEPPVKSFDQERHYYKRRINANAFHLRARARDRIAETKDPRALQLLINGYQTPENPKAFVQYLCASLAAYYFEDHQFLDTFASWRSKHKKDQDAWLWYRTLAIHLERKDANELIRIANGSDKLFLRGAAIHAMA